MAVTLLSACSSKDNIYEETIADHVQTDRHGTWTDLHFKVISLEVEECTMADSIRTLVADATEEISKAIARENEWLSDYKTGLERNEKKRYPSPTTENMYRELIEHSKQRLDSLQRIDPTKVICYEGLDPNTVLAVYATCKYGINLPGNGTYQERMDTFILTPDGKKVIGKEKNTKL